MDERDEKIDKLSTENLMLHKELANQTVDLPPWRLP